MKVKSGSALKISEQFLNLKLQILNLKELLKIKK